MFFKKKTEAEPIKDANYYNNKWPKAPIIYSGRALRGKKDNIGIDVKDFITSNDEMLKNIVSKYRLKKSTDDDTVWEIQKWVVKFLTYKYDDDENQTPEFWQFPFETLQSQHGDCEDGAILIASLCVVAGVPAWRVKVSAGYVRENPTAPQGGHAYCIYLASDGDWRVIDWCYFEDSPISVLKKPLAKEGGYNKCYGDVWFTFNNEFSWNQTSLKIDGRLFGKELKESKKSLETIMESVDKKFNTK